MANSAVSSESFATEAKVEPTKGPKLKIALVGCGGISETHLKAFALFPDVEIVAAVDVAGPSPMIRRTASSSLAPSQCTCLPKCVTKLPAGIGVVLAGSNFGPEPTHQVPCSTTM